MRDTVSAERFRGIRPAFGYPACPDHSEKGKLFDLLGAPKLGIELTETFAMAPAASVSGLYLHHPAARYFSIGRIGRDQVEDYAARKGQELRETERWLSTFGQQDLYWYGNASDFRRSFPAFLGALDGVLAQAGHLRSLRAPNP